MELWHAIILGIVEGITEYLPVSSTGHLIITSALLGLDVPAERKEAVDAFLVVIQGGAILAVVGLFWGRMRQMVAGLLGRDPIGRRLFLNICIAFAPAVVAGSIDQFVLDGVIEKYLFHPGPVMAALALGGIVMIALTPWQRRHFTDAAEGDAGVRAFVELDHLTWRKALIIGVLQCVAMWPGTSRSMMTIVGGMLVGLRPKQAAEFSFLLGLPTLGAACVLKSAELVRKGDEALAALGGWPVIIVGLVVATLAAALAIRWLVSFLSNHGVAAFGWYRLLLTAVLGVLLLTGVMVFP